MGKNQFQEIVLKAMAYIKANLGQPILMVDLVKNTGFSQRHVYNAFKKVLNQGIGECILLARLDKAKSLLLKSELDITQIAFESGFESYPCFSRAFRRKTGMSASRFREQVMQLKEIPLQGNSLVELERKEEWFRDSFPGSAIGNHWNPVWGEWRQENGCLSAGSESNQIAFLRPLPENCRISFQAYVKAIPDRVSPNFYLGIADSANTIPYCQLSIATGKRATGTVSHFREGTLWNPNARMTELEWHDIVLEINEDLLSLSVDGATAFSLRDSFPPAYSSRCNLYISSWQCIAQLQKLVIHNLGFRPVIRPIRQGDALYNAGLAQKALEFYQRLLQAGSVSDPETMELRYKIGMCCLRMGAYSQAKGWMDKIVSLREEPFWAAQAQLALLELYWKTLNMENLLEQMALCMKNPATHDGSRVIVQIMAADFISRGFFAEAVEVLKAWASLERFGDYGYAEAQCRLSECFLGMRRFVEAEQILVTVIESSPFAEMVLFSRINLMQLYHELGRIHDSEALRTRIEAEIKDEFCLVRCMVQKALNLRAKNQYEETLLVLEDIPRRYASAAAGLLAHAKIQSALILCCVGRLVQGRKALEEAKEIFPGAAGSRHDLPFHLTAGNYASAAEQLLLDHRNSKELVSASAELGIKAGILHELAGMDAEAKSIFKEVSQRFPNEQVRFFGPMANALFTGEDFDFGQMPYEAHRRSEMFYLLGLLKEKRGDREGARPLFELSVMEDPALRWPALMAKRKLP